MVKKVILMVLILSGIIIIASAKAATVEFLGPGMNKRVEVQLDLQTCGLLAAFPKEYGKGTFGNGSIGYSYFAHKETVIIPETDGEIFVNIWPNTEELKVIETLEETN